METKDWLSLCIPILCNGIILFVFQQIYSRKIEKFDKRNSYIKDVQINLLSLLQEFYMKIRNLSKIDSSRSGKEYDFAELWNPAADSIVKIVVALDTYPKTIGESNVKGSIDLLIEKWDYLNDLLYSVRIKNNGIVPSDISNEVSVCYTQIISLVKKCMYACEEEIIKY